MFPGITYETLAESGLLGPASRSTVSMQEFASVHAQVRRNGIGDYTEG